MTLTEHGSLYNMLEDPTNAYGLPEEEFLIVFEHVSEYLKDSEFSSGIFFLEFSSDISESEYHCRCALQWEKLFESAPIVL